MQRIKQTVHNILEVSEPEYSHPVTGRLRYSIATLTTVGCGKDLQEQ